MKHHLPIFPLLLVAVLSRAEHPLIYTSPARFADEAADVAFVGDAGGEAASPESEVRSQQLVVDRSTLVRTLVGFPQDFLDGLVAEERNGYVSYPISVRIDPASGCALFENAAGRVFYALDPVADNPAAPAIPAGNVVVKWRVLPEGFNAGTPQLRTSDSGLRTLAPETLRLSSIACSTNGVTIGTSWSASDIPTNGVLDLYFSTHLNRDWRVVKTMTIPAGATNLTTFLTIDDIPSYTNFPPAHVHDADCHIVTNISPNIFSGSAVVTNIHWSCAGQRTPPYEGDSGFFRLGTRDDTDGDGLPDAYETIVLGTDPASEDSDGDGLSDGAEVMSVGSNPRLADTDGDGLSDFYEVHAGFSPTSSDTDNDGLDDYFEDRESFTDPTDDDSDGDGLPDGEEIFSFGTSPFHSDSDGDGVSDFREIRELGSNPLSSDTDGDGIDDHTEYTGRNYGLSILSASDAPADTDGDGLSNLQEIRTAGLWLVPASSNAVPRLRLLRIHPLEAPKVSSSTIHSRVLALGEHPTKGSVIRIPRSTPYGTTNAIRRLHYTDAPGIYLGGHSLAGGGVMVFPDDMGDVDLPVRSSPEYGGTVCTLTLEGTDFVSPATATLAVPKMTGATLRLTNAPSPVDATNLVNGIRGVLCVEDIDTEYGFPRFHLSPRFENDSPEGHRLLFCTDLVLVKVSGATNLTTTANYLRWDSASIARRGVSLPTGVSRVEAGIDFDFDGELDSEEVAVSCDVHVVQIGLLADTDRNGEINSSDIRGLSNWKPGCGALLAVDNPPATVDGLRSADNSPLATLFALPTMAEVPPDYSLDLHVEGSPSRAVFYASGFTNRLEISSANVITQGLDNALMLTGQHFRVSFDRPSSRYGTNPEIEVSLRLRRGVHTVASDTAVLKAPPLVIPWNTLPLRRLWTCDSEGAGRFPASVAADRQVCLPRSLHGAAQWTQDIVQAFAFQRNEPDGWQTAFADLGHSLAAVYPDALVEEGEFLGEQACIFSIANGGNGGNVEATPPLPGYPYGRLLTGTNTSDHVCAAVEVAEAQGLQGPAIKLPVGWLAVGHVDEICCFIGERTVMISSPRLAFHLIAQEVAAHNGNYTNTFVWGTDPTNYIHRMQDILFDKVVTNANWATDLTAEATTVVAPIHDYAYGDVVCCENEIIRIPIYENNLDGTATLYLDRGFYGTAPQQHSRSAPVLWLSETAKENYREHDDYNIPQPCFFLHEVFDRLQDEIPMVSFIPVPVLYTKAYGKFVAGTPNLVNAVVDGNTVYMTDPGCDLFRNAVNVPGKAFVGGHDVWSLYHCLMGELHCGSEAEREIPAVPPWWQRPEFANWPYEKKDVSP